MAQRIIPSTSESDAGPPERDPWLGVELRHLAALAAVAREGSFSAAAESLGYVQSAVSQQISALEKLVGTRLLERSRFARGVALTDAGSLVLAHAESMLDGLRAAQADLANLTTQSARTLRVGLFESIAARMTPALLSLLATRSPGLGINTRETSHDASLFTLVADGHLDVAFTELPLPSGPFEVEPLVLDEHVLVVHSESHLARANGEPSPEEIAALPLIVQSTSRLLSVDALLRNEGISPTVIFRPAHAATVQALVSAGLGAAVLPRLAVDPGAPNIAILDVGDLVRPRTIGMVWHQARGEDAQLDELRAAAREISTEL